MKILYGDVLPGVGIGKIKLGMDAESVIKYLGNDYKKEKREGAKFVISIENARFWFDSNEKLQQIGVTYGFCSKYDGIGIGDSLLNVQNNGREFYEEYDDYLIKGIDGLCFELEDIDDWDELKAPIEWIFVYR